MKPEKLKELRKEIGLSLAEASRQVHVTARTWARYEAGDRKIPQGVIELFCIKNKLNYQEQAGMIHSFYISDDPDRYHRVRIGYCDPYQSGIIAMSLSCESDNRVLCEYTALPYFV